MVAHGDSSIFSAAQAGLPLASSTSPCCVGQRARCWRVCASFASSPAFPCFSLATSACGSTWPVRASVQASMLLPPQLLLIRPCGTPVRTFMSLAKNQQTAENLPTVAGLAATQLPPASRSCGCIDALLGILKWRMEESFAFASSAAASRPSDTMNSMFDWPEHSHTSPTSTSRTTRCSLPSSMSSAYGPPAAWRGSVASQRPFASASAVACAPSKPSLTRAPGVDQPHTCMGCSRCSTAPCENISGSSSFACAAAGNSRPSASAPDRNRCFMAWTPQVRRR